MGTVHCDLHGFEERETRGGQSSAAVKEQLELLQNALREQEKGRAEDMDTTMALLEELRAKNAALARADSRIEGARADARLMKDNLAGFTIKEVCVCEETRQMLLDEGEGFITVNFLEATLLVEIASGMVWVVFEVS